MKTCATRVCCSTPQRQVVFTRITNSITAFGGKMVYRTRTRHYCPAVEREDDFTGEQGPGDGGGGGERTPTV